MARLVTSFDSVVLAAVAREIAGLVGSRLTRVAQGDPDEVTLMLRGAAGTGTILCSIHPRWARVHLTSGAAGGETSPFAQMLRSRLESARLAGVRQPPFERVLVLALDTTGGPVELIAEVMGRHSNLMLVEDGVIAGSLKPVPRAKSSVREVLPGRPYVLPPQDRLSPLALTNAALDAALSASEEPLAARVVASVLGLSPALAAHLVARAGGDPLAPARSQSGAARRLWDALHELATTVTAGTFSPVIYYEGDQPVGYSAFPLAHLAALRQVPSESMSAAVDIVMGRHSAAARTEELRVALLGAVRAGLARVERTEREVSGALQQAEQTGRLRRHGELLLAYASQVPRGAAEVTLPGFDGAPMTIELDPTLTAVENAQRLFKRYGRVRAARPVLDARARKATEERAYLESAATLIEQATTIDDLFDLRRELVEERYLRARRARARPVLAASGPRRFGFAGGVTVLVGRTNRENDVVTFKLASPGDIWLHARGVPGAHVIIKRGPRDPAEGTVHQAAAIAAYFSAARGSTTTAVDYTERRHVRKPKGAKPGVVTYTHERTVHVTPKLPGTGEQGNGGAR